MRRDSRMSGVLHVLLHMAEIDGPVMSETMAKIIEINPVVIRRIMAGLREAGLVRSEKGHDGGRTIERDLAIITLRDVYQARNSPELFGMGNRADAPGCLVEESVNAALGRAFDEARALLLDRFASVTLAQLSADFHARMVANGKDINLRIIHAA
ncbi:Rrf2 family transcriptional regulator [Novosphingobium sp. FGD1]|uniref:Rrf2 family transcriptional regulator n=1 Tax=Novosphingobium silvae TaxID=2692619 RepID=A0A7X4K8F3_9SPHN|nr:Rrf2 family transcriptional regulator [Novosphingobium silvae]MYM00117.1 Rrf2 family transcriptional regulator [Novosphingobium silvae]